MFDWNNSDEWPRLRVFGHATTWMQPSIETVGVHYEYTDNLKILAVEEENFVALIRRNEKSYSVGVCDKFEHSTNNYLWFEDFPKPAKHFRRLATAVDFALAAIVHRGYADAIEYLQQTTLTTRKE